MIFTLFKRFPQHWRWLALILLVGVGLRFFRIETLPPALSGDEVLVTLLARDVVARQEFPIYFPGEFGGFHPVIVYLTMLARWVTGNHLLAVRFGVAAMGVISIPLVFLALHSIFRLDDKPPERALAEALLGAGVFAITFPNVLIHRLGFEVMLPAPISALAFWGLASALRTERRRHYWLTGCALGAGAYTYYTAYFAPMAVAVALAWIWLTASAADRRPLRTGFSLIVAGAALASAPLALYFLQNPDLFVRRAGDVSGATLRYGVSGIPWALIENIFKALASLSIPGFGDVIARHNIPGHPVFDVFLSVLFWLGVVVLTRLWRGSRIPMPRLSSVLLAAWAGAMVIPVLVTMSLDSPHFTRLQGATPALAGIAALGGSALYNFLARHRDAATTDATGTWLARLTFAAGLSFSTGATAYDYFVRWPQEPEVFEDFQVSVWDSALIAQERSTTGIVYLTPDLVSDYSRAAYNLILQGNPNVREFPSAGCLVYIDSPTRPLTYVVDMLLDKHSTIERLVRLYPTGKRGSVILSQPPPRFAWPLVAFFEVPAGASAAPLPHPASVRFGESIKLMGYSISPSTPRAGDDLTVQLYWQTSVPLAEFYSAFVHLHVPGEPEPIAQSDSEPCQAAYQTTRWLPGEIVIDTHTLTVPPDFPADAANLAVGMYVWPSLERLPVHGVDSPDQRFHLPDLPISR